MKFKIIFQDVCAHDVSHIVDAFAGNGKLTISAETKDSYNTGTYQVVTTRYEDLYTGADSMRNLHSFLTKTRSNRTESEKQ